MAGFCVDVVKGIVDLPGRARSPSQPPGYGTLAGGWEGKRAGDALKKDGRMGFIQCLNTWPAHAPIPTTRARVPWGGWDGGVGWLSPINNGRMGFIRVFGCRPPNLSSQGASGACELGIHTPQRAWFGKHLFSGNDPPRRTAEAVVMGPGSSPGRRESAFRGAMRRSPSTPPLSAKDSTIWRAFHERRGLGQPRLTPRKMPSAAHSPLSGFAGARSDHLPAR